MYLAAAFAAEGISHVYPVAKFHSVSPYQLDLISGTLNDIFRCNDEKKWEEI